MPYYFTHVCDIRNKQTKHKWKNEENSIETCILSRVKQITSPGWMHETSARTWPGALGRPRGSGWRGRWEGGSVWGTHVNPWLFHFNVWQNSLPKKKKKVKKSTKNKCVDKENRVVATRSEGARMEGKMCKRDQLCGDGWRLELWWWHAVVYIEV